MPTNERSDYRYQEQKYPQAFGEHVGDCFRTCVACLLEISRDTVPNFAEKFIVNETSLEWWTDAIAFVEQHSPGLTLVCVRPDFPIYEQPDTSFDRVIVTGKSPRGEWNHSIIADAKTGSMIWDPHPAKQGVLNQLDVIALTTTVAPTT